MFLEGLVFTRCPWRGSVAVTLNITSLRHNHRGQEIPLAWLFAFYFCVKSVEISCHNFFFFNLLHFYCIHLAGSFYCTPDPKTANMTAVSPCLSRLGRRMASAAEGSVDSKAELTALLEQWEREQQGSTQDLVNILTK